MILKNEIRGTESGGTKVSLEDKGMSGKRSRTAEGLDCLLDSEDLNYTRPKINKQIHKTTRTPLCILS